MTKNISEMTPADWAQAKAGDKFVSDPVPAADAPLYIVDNCLILAIPGGAEVVLLQNITSEVTLSFEFSDTGPDGAIMNVTTASPQIVNMAIGKIRISPHVAVIFANALRTYIQGNAPALTHLLVP